MVKLQCTEHELAVGMKKYISSPRAHMLQGEGRYVGTKIIGRYIDKLQEREVLKGCINSVFTHVFMKI